VNAGATRFFATGVSIVIHPASPMVPIIHMNIRYFETDAGDAWFGGGIDLTPIYVNEAQASFFHLQLKDVCDRYSSDFYPKFKTWADDYFFITHRNETRGIGGIFFDYLRPSETLSKEFLLRFVADVGRTFLRAYLPIVAANKLLEYTDEHKQWQWVRRGRYVEFNLVYDRGTRFGLETGGRIESILMSLPEHASWIYNHIPQTDSEEAHTLAKLKKGIDWVSLGGN
jgi:coproporphyrinogen III oxidase